MLAACGGDSSEGGGPDSPEEPGDSPVETDAGNEATSDGTRIFVATGFGIDIVDLEAESQESFVEGYETPFGLTVAQGDLWFADAENTLVSVEANSGNENGSVALPGQFSGIAVSEDTAWVLAGLIGVDSQVVAVARDGMTISGSALPPEFTYYDLIAASGDSVWVHGGDVESSTTVSKVDPATVTVGDPVDSGLIADSMVIGAGALWIGGTKPGESPASAIAKLDPSTGDVLATVEIGGHGDGEVEVQVAFDHVWATQGLDAVLIKFDQTGEEIDRVEVGSGAAGIPYPILVTNDAIWVVNTTDNQALSFDPDTLEFQSGINMPSFSGAFAFVP